MEMTMELVDQDALPVQDELDPQEESPYLRRQKSVPGAAQPDFAAECAWRCL